MPSPALTDQDTRLCEHCYRRLPITQFKWRSHRRGREVRCRECRNEYERQLQMRRRRDQRDETTARFALLVNRARTERQIIALVEEMVQHFRGVRNFARAWNEQIERARQYKPGTKRILDSHRAIVRLMELCHKQEPQLQQLDDAELARQLQAQVADLIAERPELVLQVAEALGWTVIPPDESELVGSQEAASR